MSGEKIKAKIAELKVELADTQLHMQRLETRQMTIKIQINSTYGYMGNKRAPVGDDDIAASVTLTGQAVIKEAAAILQRHLKQEYGIVDEQALENSWVYSDTDSCYFSLDCIKDSVVKFQNDDGSVTDEFYEACNKLEDDLNVEITAWAKRTLLTQDSRFIFKREVIADSAIFIKKKRYVMHILDDEGIKDPKFKYKGVEVVRTTMPNAIKPYAKDIINTMLSTKSLSETNKLLNKAYDEFIKLPAEEMSFVMGIGDYDGAAAKCSGFNIGKGVPIHAKAAYLHNQFNNKFGIDNKYESIGTGDKIRYFYVEQPNRYGVNVIGFKYDLPEEYKDVFLIDYDLMFEKIFFNSIKRLYDSVKWKSRKPSENVTSELFDLFS
tara:strand:+ start:17 stop:1153 length:1137 start_codon:yes stop_codon:yes gene_type:complete